MEKPGDRKWRNQERKTGEINRQERGNQQIGTGTQKSRDRNWRNQAQITRKIKQTKNKKPTTQQDTDNAKLLL